MEDEADNEAPDFSEFEGKSVKEVLEEGQKVLLMSLVGRVRKGQASHQEQAILARLLKDNGLVLGLNIGGADTQPAEMQVPVDLPDFPDPNYTIN